MLESYFRWKSVREAVRHWQRVRELADEIEDAALATELGWRSRAMILENAWRLGVSQPQADELLREGEAWARRQSDPRALAYLYNAYATAISLGPGQHAHARELCEEGLRLAQAAGDEPLVFTLELRLAHVIFWTGDARAARRALEVANAHPRAVMEAASPLVGFDPANYTSGFLGYVVAHEGRFEEGLRHLDQAIERARARGTTEMLGLLLSMEAEIWLERGDLSRAAHMARESMEIAERIESPLSRGFAASVLSRVFAQEGDLDAAIALVEQAIQDTARTSRFALPHAMSDLAEFRCARGERVEGRRLALEALHLAETEGFRYGQLAAELVLARIALLDSQPDDASAWLARAEQTLDATGHLWRLPELLELRAGLAQLRGDAPGRERALREAQRLYNEMGASGQVERIARELGR